MENNELIERMIEVIEKEVEYTRELIGRDRLADTVMAAMREVPRHEFIPPEHQTIAYSNGPVVIGHGQTISQPYIVALMTDLLNPQPDDIILEIGTGSGYQAAVLSLCVKQLYSMEDVAPLVQPAKERLARLGYDNVEVREGDGYFGWAEHAPYDGIIVTAAAPHIPETLVSQLKPGACLVIPVGGQQWGQALKVIEKQLDGRISVWNVLDVVFVPLTGLYHNQPAEIDQ